MMPGTFVHHARLPWCGTVVRPDPDDKRRVLCQSSSVSLETFNVVVSWDVRDLLECPRGCGGAG